MVQLPQERLELLQICRVSSLLIMDIPWLLVTVIGLATTEVSCVGFGTLPSLPEKGLPCIKYTKYSCLLDISYCVTITSQFFNHRHASYLSSKCYNKTINFIFCFWVDWLKQKISGFIKIFLKLTVYRSTVVLLS